MTDRNWRIIMNDINELWFQNKKKWEERKMFRIKYDHYKNKRREMQQKYDQFTYKYYNNTDDFLFSEYRKFIIEYNNFNNEYKNMEDEDLAWWKEYDKRMEKYEKLWEEYNSCKNALISKPKNYIVYNFIFSPYTLFITTSISAYFLYRHIQFHANNL